MFPRPLVEHGRYVNAVATGRLAGRKGQYHAFEPTNLTRRNHMDNCYIVVCLRHKWSRAVAQGPPSTRKLRWLCLLAKAMSTLDALASWP